MSRILAILLLTWSAITLIIAIFGFWLWIAGFGNNQILFLIVFNSISFILSGLAGLYLLRRRGG